MTNTADRNLIVGLDIGTTKVVVLVGEVLPDGELNVIGMGSHASRGMEKGGVNDLDSVVKSLRRAVEAAAVDAGGLRLQVTASIGVAERMGDATEDWRTLVELADHRMYYAKQNGRNGWVQANMAGPQTQREY
mgnify:CR=1 FL=1